MTGRLARSLLPGLALMSVLAGCQMTPLASAAGRAPAAAPSSSASASPALPFDVSPLLDPASGKFLGLETDQTAGTLAPVRAFAAAVGRKPNLIGQYVAWGSRFNAAGVARAWSYGALSYLAWEPYHPSLRAIAAGGSDAYIRQFAQAVRRLALPVVISFGHEMNGTWYPWGSAQASAADFVAAWRHIHQVFLEAGASNVIWMWNPNIINDSPGVALRPFYPGDAYVDWVGITGYFPTTGAHTFASLFQPTVRAIRRFTGKPLLIAETAVETGPDEVLCVHQLVGAVARDPGLLGFVWFDFYKNGVDWRAESRPILRGALARALAPVHLTGVVPH
jgi:hypothetical protein